MKNTPKQQTSVVLGVFLFSVALRRVSGMNPARQRGWRRAAPDAWRVGGGSLSVFSAAGLHRPRSPRRRTASAQGGMAAHPLASNTSTARTYPTPALMLWG